MAITVTEKPNRRRSFGESPQVTRQFTVRDAESDVLAADAMLAFAGTGYDGLILKSYSIDELRVLSPGGTPSIVFDGEVVYSKAGQLNPPPSTGDFEYEFDTTGSDERITQSLETVGTYVPPDALTSPDFDGAIGVTRDGVEGATIIVPRTVFSETHYIPSASVDDAYRAILRGLTGRVNDGDFKGTSRGETLFLGAKGGARNSEDMRITFSFAVSPNVTGRTIGTITGIDKEGWHLLWVLYDEAVVNNRLVKSPAAVIVEQVYEYGDFGLLGIGT